ncbi:MAG: MFS transporter [Ignavibacteria bacterium]|jgi:MFS family permease
MFKSIYNLYRDSFSGLPKPVWHLCIVMLLNRSGSIVLFFLTLYLTKELNYTNLEAGKVITIYGLGSLVGSFLGGWLTDRLNSKKVQFYSLITSGITYICLDFMRGSYEVTITVFLVAMFADALRPANATSLAEFSPKEITSKSYALNRLAINLGVAIGPAIGGFLALVDYSLLFWIDGLTCLFAACLFYYFFHTYINEKKKQKHDNSKSQFPWKDKIFILVLIITIPVGLLFIQVFNTWPIYLKEYFIFNEDTIGILVAINAFMITFFEMPLIHKINNYNPLKVMAAGSLFLFGGFAIQPFGSGFSYAAITIVTWTIGEMLVLPLLISYIASLSNEKNRGKYMGMFSFTFSLTIVLGPVFGMWLYQNLGANPLWFIVGITGFIVSLGFLLLDKYITKTTLKTKI